jgi:hypothetical protein
MFPAPWRSDGGAIRPEAVRALAFQLAERVELDVQQQGGRKKAQLRQVLDTFAQWRHRPNEVGDLHVFISAIARCDDGA